MTGPARPTVFLLVIAVVVASDTRYPQTILRCCPEGQTLHVDQEGRVEEHCRKVGKLASVKWPPYIYSPQAKVFLNKTPDNWIIKVSKPQCAYVPVISYPPPTTPSFLLFDSGSLWVQDLPQLMHPLRFCVDEKVALTCLDNGDLSAARRKTKIKKCCGDGAAYSEGKFACVNFVDEAAVFSNLAANLSVGSTTFVSGFPVCDAVKPGDARFVIAEGFDQDKASIDPDGVLRLMQPMVTLQPKEYCLEHVYEHPVVKANIFTCPGVLPSDTDNLTRTQDKLDWDLRFTLYPIGLVLSVFFLAATLAVGFILPSTHQHMLHWRCQTGHVACLLVGDLLLAITQFSAGSMSGVVCLIIASVMHFFFLSAFFWLNTMCFNIWWTFRDMRPASLDKEQETLRLRLYQLYAWGGPLAFAGVAAIMDRIPEEMHRGLIRPRFGHQRCWFAGDIEIFTYFYGPLGVLLVINLVFFAMTARELTCGLWKRDVAKSNVERTALSRVCLKLVVVMGLTWGTDIVSWAIGGPHYLWYMTDLINALQGVFIFIVVGCQPQIWAAINRMWCFKGGQHSENANMGQNMSSCSQGLPSMGDSITNGPTTKSVPLETTC